MQNKQKTLRTCGIMKNGREGKIKKRSKTRQWNNENVLLQVVLKQDNETMKTFYFKWSWNKTMEQSKLFHSSGLETRQWYNQSLREKSFYHFLFLLFLDLLNSPSKKWPKMTKMTFSVKSVHCNVVCIGLNWPRAKYLRKRRNLKNLKILKILKKF